MAVTAPPRPPDATDPIDRDELEALIEALIEEARRRARRRRRRIGAAALLVALVAGTVYLGFDHSGGGAIGSRSAEASPSGGATAVASVAAGRWETSHGPYGGPAYVIATAPRAPSVVYVGTARGVFASRNDGRSWHSAGLAVPLGSLQVVDPRITSLAVDPRAPATVYAARSISIDGGFTFRQELFKSTNGGRSWHGLGMAAGQVFVSPATSDTVYAISGSVWKTNRLFRSTNGGRSWQPADRRLASTVFWGIAFDPTTPSTVYAATGQGVFKSTDGGHAWQRGRDALSRQAVSAIAVDPQDRQILYAGTDGGVIKSIDAGRTWRMVNTVMGSHGRDRAYGQVSSFVVDPLDSQRVYATARCAGIFKSSNGGRSWSAANAAPVQCLDSSLALVASAPQTIFGVYAWRGVFKSTDGAAHWHATNTGLSLTTVESLAVDPNKPGTVYASTRQLGLFKSSDGGHHWRPVAHGLVDAVAIDPHNPRIVLAAGPRPRAIRSTDAGRTWQPAGAGIAATPQALAISGANAYAGTLARGVYRSNNGGRSWHPSTAPLESYVQALAIAPDDPAVVYAGGGGSDARGLYKSTDAGRTWQRLTDGLEDTDVSAVALDPKHPTTLYIGTGEKGIFKSTDAGAGWQPAGSGLPRIRVKGITAAGKAVSFTSTVGITALAIDAANPTTLYAATSGLGIYRSTDAGSTWHPLNAALAVLEIKSLAIAATGRTLYAGSAGSGVVTLHVRSN